MSENSYPGLKDPHHKIDSGNPRGNTEQSSELASIYVYLASGESSYVPAEIMGITGGQYLP